MPIYEDETTTIADLEKIRRTGKCKVCGAKLNIYLDGSGKAFVACWDWLRTHHEGIEKEASRYQKEGLASLNIPTRRRMMEKEHGQGMTTTLEKARIPTTGALTQSQAMHILKLVYPYVPEDEIIRTAILCRDFGLHPLMKEVYIIGFKNTKTGKVDYSTVIGIAANRKMAADKKGAYSFIDLSPRAASKEEIIKQYGANSEEERDNLISICILKGEKGNEAVGYGLWPKNEEPRGTNKGNTKRNMANIRSERQALDRLPGEALPLRDLDVIDEAYAEVPDMGKVSKTTGEIIEGESTEIPEEALAAASAESETKEHWCYEHNCAFEKKHSRFGDFYAHKAPDGSWCNEAKKKGNASKQASKPEELTEEEELEQAPFLKQVEEDIGAVEPQKSQQPKRDPDTIKTINELYKACNEDFKLQPYQVIAELGVSSQSDISDSPAECYRQIAAVR